LVERLHHGWFAVKNRSTMDIREGVTMEERNIREREFFAQVEPWTELPKDRVGIDNVKHFLGGLLYDHIKGEFPSMVKEIEDQARETQDSLELLGPSRQTPVEQRRVLLRIGLTYQNDVMRALSGNYDQDLSADRTLKLRLRIRELNDEFAEDMNRKGHARAFRTIKDEVDQEFSRPSDSGDEENIYSWIRTLYRDSRGVELPGTVNPAVLQSMFRQQAAPWDELAQKYFDSICKSLSAFNAKVFAAKIPDDDLKQNLRARLQPLERSAFGRAKGCLMQILRDEKEGILQTVNNYFAETVSSIREERVRARLYDMGLQDDNMVYSVSLNQVMSRLHLSNEDQAVHDIHDILKAYYKVALKRFTDNVILQVTERHLLGPEGPVKILSPEWIGEFSDADLADVASENFATSSARNELQARLDKLHRALDIARQAGI
jgi:hypothetical protein